MGQFAVPRVRAMIPHHKLVLTPAEKAAANRVLDSGLCDQGEEAAALERELAAAFRPGDDAACVSSGSAALYLALAVSGVWANDEVLIPAYSCAALYHSVRLTGARPVFLDSTEDFGLDMRHLSARERACKALVFDYPHGIVPREVTALPEWPLLIEDFTRAPGLRIGGSPCGSLGDLSVISFAGSKPLGVGGGGAVLGPHETIQRVREMRDYDQPGLVPRFNFRMSDIHAAMVRERLKRLAADWAWRLNTASAFLQAFIDRFGPPYTCAAYDATRFLVASSGMVGAEIVAALVARGVEAILPIAPGELLAREPVALTLTQTFASVPYWPGMPDEARATVARAIAEVLC